MSHYPSKHNKRLVLEGWTYDTPPGPCLSVKGWTTQPTPQPHLHNKDRIRSPNGSEAPQNKIMHNNIGLYWITNVFMWFPPLPGVNWLSHQLATAKVKAICECCPFSKWASTTWGTQETCRSHSGEPRMYMGSTQEPPKRHPRATQEAPKKHPEGTHAHPESSRGTERSEAKRGKPLRFTIRSGERRHFRWVRRRWVSPSPKPAHKSVTS